MINKNLPIPKNEVARLAALAQYNILDTLPEEEFDRLTQLASIICAVPVALITLIDKDRQWFKSTIGLNAAGTPRDISFCQYTINGESLFEIEDATKDERFLSNPLVTDQPNIRFYAGHPLIDPDGYALGSLCVIDREARILTAVQRQCLTLLSNEVVSQIVSRKKNAEKDKLEKLFNLSIDMICVMGTDGYLKKINPAFAITLGWTIKELLAKPFINFLHPDDITRTINQIEKLKRGEKSIEFQNRYITKNGDYLTISWTAAPDEITGERYVIARDITERKKAEEKILAANKELESYIGQLRESEEKLRVVLDSAQIGAWDLNIVKDTAWRSLLHDQIFGYDHLLPEWGYEIFISHVIPEDREYVKQRFEDAYSKGKFSMECRIKRANDNSIRWISAQGLAYQNEKGEVIKMMGIVIDITDQKQLKIELENEKIKAEAASKAKESFLANMSHEIRTPLNAIIGFLRELEKQELSGIQKTYIDNSTIASKYLLAILNNILDISKIEAGEMSLENEDFIIEDTINNVVNVLQSTAKEKGIKLSALILDKVNKVFKGDSLRIEEILFNLVGNALKFTQKGKIEVKCEVLSDSHISQKIQISVADTGIGMEQKYAESIFEKFSQEDKSITRKYGGTGLGMAITKELVNLMGGEIEIESEKNKGTTINIKINLIKGNTENVKKLQIKVDFNLKGLSILLVEDNEMNRMVIQRTLHYFNCNVTVAENGLEAVEILKTRNFDLILMDIQMPEMDGIEATEVIRKELKLSTPIIALTADAFKTEIEKCRQAGMNDYVVKPFEETVLLHTIVKHTINKNLGIPSLDNEMNPNQPLYNLNVLHNSSRGNDEFVLKMAGVFVEQTIATIEKIDAALESNNFLEISRLIHKIRPSTDNMGVLSIQSEMKTLEKIAKETQNKGQITAMYTLVKKTLQLVISQLQKNELNV